MLACNWADGHVTCCLQAGVGVHLLLVVSDRCFCHRAHIALLRLCSVGMIGRQDRGSGSDHGADGVVHGLTLGLLDGALECWALGREGRLGLEDRDRGVLLEVVVVVGGGAYDRARLSGSVRIQQG